MRKSTFAALLLALLVSISASFAQESPRYGRIVHGVMFKHIDRDGDGKYEEWRRGEWRHYDSNRDGKPDVFQRGSAVQYTQGWDSDLDGVYDTAQEIVLKANGEADAGPEYPIEINTPTQAIKRDRARRVERIPARPSS